MWFLLGKTFSHLFAQTRFIPTSTPHPHLLETFPGIIPCLCFPSEVKVLVAQSCLALRDSTGCSPPGFSVHGILQARILERLVIPFLVGILPYPGTELRRPASQADSSLSEPPEEPTQTHQLGLVPFCSMFSQCALIHYIQFDELCCWKTGEIRVCRCLLKCIEGTSLK